MIHAQRDDCEIPRGAESWCMLQESSELEARPSTSQAEEGGPPPDGKGRPDEKGHWKLRALANIRRHSDTDIFVNSANRKYALPTQCTSFASAGNSSRLQSIGAGYGMGQAVGFDLRMAIRIPLTAACLILGSIWKRLWCCESYSLSIAVD